MRTPENNDLIAFANETVSADSISSHAHWRILIVDDEPEVHEATRFALKDQLILGRSLDITSVYTAEEARVCLKQSDQFACILLDVVMETPDAGLLLVGFIRDTLKEDTSRIILRTGQPGYAPEVDVIEKYDINDYKSKDELTRNHLITTITSSIRSFQQIKTIKANKTGLAMIIDGAPNLFRERAVGSFAQGVLLQLCSLLQIENNSFLCCHEDSNTQAIKVLAAFGSYSLLHGETINTDEHTALNKDIMHVLNTKQHLFSEHHVMLYMQSPHSDTLVVRVETKRLLTEIDLHLLELFSVSVSVGFDNARLFEKMEELAYIDTLTKLPNRTGLIYQLEKQIETQSGFTLLLADIDTFQTVNDGLGYQIGDLTLITMAQHLKALFGPTCLLGRVSADTFCIDIPCTDKKFIAEKLEELEASLEHSFSIQGYEIPLSLTIGIATFPQHGKNADTLLQNASIALKYAKKKHRAGYSEFGKEFEQELQQRLHMAAELRHCVERNELHLMYQAQICLKTKRILGAEALVRWTHKGQIIPPNDFISTAESSGYIVPMGYWILEEACRQQVEWKTELSYEITIAVNVSIRQLKDPQFLKRTDQILEKTGINPSSLEIEVTESMMMEDNNTLHSVLNDIRKRGIQVALDDFGTGYSSLSYLQQLPIDHLKIDQSFISKITKSSQDSAITALMISIGELLNLKVIAEGVETYEQQEELIKLGCSEAQGYFYSKPISKTEFIKLLTTMNQ
ncbi:EAL domain-containing protein [Neptunomonas japonica]|uniref:Signal transduction protein n=1 Tax=Neptunomonas japonica JAMM 1380 TaxID=1441457 RepID=A0A7R6PTI5_9GAMM|nr:EAL domain-containing protein [Neptunomonas japonica]BBB29188.1 signal transduction protein [Neptunomonas japonica JAMM 1380]